MGPFLGKPTPMGPRKLPALLMETQIFAMWTIDDVKKVMNKLRTQIFGFSLIESQFESVVSFRSDVTAFATIEDLFQILDNDHDGRIDGLEFIGSLVLVCRASFEEKVKLLFEAFDFNLGGSLSKTELTMMITSCVCGLIALTGQNEDAEPDLKYFEQIIEEAFQKADRDQSGSVSFEEFIIWARSNRDIMNSLDIMNRVNSEAMCLNDEDSADESEEEFLDDEDIGDRGLVHADKNANVHVEESGNKEDEYILHQMLVGSKQWRIQVADGEPTNYPYEENLDTPASNLQLQWIHGQGKSNVRYVSVSENDPPTMVAYTCACVAIVYNIEQRQQRFYQGHTNEILCLAIHPNGHHIATGDAASNIHVWDALTCKLVRSIKVLGSFGVKLIVFSPSNGDRIASVSRDPDHTLSLHDCASGLIIGSGKGFSAPNDVFDIAYSPSADEIVIVGRKKIKFFRGLNSAKRDLGATEGKIGHQWKKRTYFCVAYVNNDAVVGCSDGSIYQFKGVQCTRAIQAHALNEPVLCMMSKEGILVTGGKDGLIKSWDNTFKEVGASLDMSEDRDGDGRPDSGSLNVAIQSVDVYDNKILVNTKGADIFHVKMPRSSNDELTLDRISSGHPTGQVWGLATHPLKEIFATCGDDKTLRLWSLRGEEQTTLRVLPDIARAVAYSPDGEILVLGMGNGSVALIEANSQSLRAYSTFCDSKEQISQIKFSNDGFYLAIGSLDSNIYIYRSTDRRNFRKFSICRGHMKSVCQIDFSVNSMYLRSNGDDDSLIFWDVNGNQIRIPHLMRDTVWATHNCSMSWCTQGLWPNYSLNDNNEDDDYVNACEAVPELDVIISGYVGGKVKLHRYPTPSPDSISQVYSGHAQAVSNVAFSGNKHFAVSVGKDDGAILIWKHALEQHDSDHEDDEDEDYIEEFMPTGGDEGIALAEEEVDGDGLDATLISKPWKMSIIEPEDVEVPIGATDVDLKLEWVHGFRSNGDCRNNLCYSGSGEIIFHAAALAVVQSKRQGTQRFLQGVHFDDIISFAMHPSGEIFATGDECKSFPKVVVWNALDMKVLSTLIGTHKQGICLLAFNPKGDLLASVGLDAQNTMMVHDWKTGVCLTQTSTDRCKLSALTFMGEYDNIISLVSASESNLKFWQIRGQNAQCQQAIWGKSVKGRVKCMVSMGDDIVVTGTSRGLIHIWCKHDLMFPSEKAAAYTFQTAVEAQKSFHNPHVNDDGNSQDKCNSILSMWTSKKAFSEIQPITNDNEEKEPELIITADSKGIIAVWSYHVVSNEKNELSYSLELVKKINLRKSDFKLSSYTIQSVCSREGVFLIGTQASEILEIWEDTDSSSSDAKEWAKVTGSRLNGSHALGEVWGLSIHPKKPLVYTTGDDQTVRVWNLASKQHKQVCFVKLPAKSRAVVVSPGYKRREGDPMEHHKGENIKFQEYVYDVAVAMNTGEIWLFESSEMEKLPNRDVNGNGIDPLSIANENALHFKQIRDAQMVITDMKYSSNIQDPSTLLLAVGCHNSFIYIYSVFDNYELHYLLLGHTNYISHMDFGCIDAKKDASVCGISDLVLQSCCGDCVVKFWTLTTDAPSDGFKLDVVTENDNNNEFKENDLVIMGVSKIGRVNKKEGEGDAALYEIDVDGTIHKLVNAYRLQKLPKFKYKAEPVSSLSSVKNAEWFTMTCPFNWAVQGIWPSKADGSEINAISRSNLYKIVPAVATADDYGSVKLFNYPCTADCSLDKCYRGHSAQITNIIFNFDDSYCISVGGEDQCVFIWATDIPDERREKEEVAKNSSIKKSLTLNTNSTGNVTNTTASTNDAGALLRGSGPEEDFENKLVLSEPKSGDEFTAVKPWKASIREPIDFVETPSLGSAPTDFLELNWVYGYRSWDCRNNIGFADSLDEIVYHVAGVGVVLNTETYTQVHNLEHDDDILCLAVHPQGHTVATGEVGRKPKLVIWDANTGMTLRVIKFHTKGISQVAFTLDGAMVVSVGMDDNRMVAVHNIATGILIGKGKAGRGVSIYGITVGAKHFVTCGKNHVKFWDLPSDNPVGELSSKSGLFGKAAVKKTAVCTAYLNSDAVTGMSDGNLLQWKGRNATVVAKGHTKAVTAMCSLDESHYKLASGGADGKVNLWTSQMQKIVELSVSDFTLTSRCPKVQALNAKDGRLVLGTYASEIYEVDITAPQRDTHPAVKLVNGHCEGSAEIWGLSSHPKMKEFATAGDDMTVRIWDSRVKQMKVLIDIPAKARTIAYSPDGSQLAVGLMDGKLIVLNVQGNTATTLADVQVSKKAIQVLAYSPDGRCLAAGCHDSRIHLLDTKTFGSRAQCKGHHSFISHLDFSKDGKVLQSVSGDYELLFWEVATGKQIVSPTEVRDTKWDTCQSILGWGVKGIWPPEADGTDINAVSRSPDESLLVTGDDYGKVKLFKYPCCKENSKFKGYKGHSAHVANVRFSSDGNQVYSVGGLDKAVLQFEVKRAEDKKKR